jgi:hypothetical protein
MKSLFITLLILGTAFLGYDYFLVPPWERLVFEQGPRPKQPAPGMKVSDDSQETAAGLLPPRKELVVTSSYEPTVPSIPSREFVPPKLASLEELTKQWTTVPPHAFPRRVKLHAPVDVKMAMGSARIPKGATAFAYSAAEGLLSVAPTETSTARGAVAIRDTDLPEQLEQSYAKLKSAKIDAARKAWLARKTAKPVVNVTINEPLDLSGALDPAGRPLQARDGTYPLLLASMRAGDVTDITQPQVSRWGEAERRTIEGLPTWTVDVWYTTMAFCGPMEARAQAHVRDGHVVAWIYPGSGEPVP